MRGSVAYLALTMIVVLSGCSTGPGEDGLPVTESSIASDLPSEVPADVQGDEASTVRISFDYTGNIGSMNCVPSGPNSCINAQQPQGQENTRYNTSVIGKPLRVLATLSWNSTQSQTQRLEFGVVAVRGDEGSYVEGQKVVGTSPLVLELTELAWREGDWSPYVVVGQPNQYSRPLYGFQHGPEEFHVVGHLVGNETGVPGRILGIPS